MDGMDITYGGAFIAGILSFLSPCVLPLVPPYLCFLGGVTIDQITDEGTIDRAVSRRVFISALAFVLGFSTVFIGLGASASTFGQAIANYFDVLSKIAGGVIIILGLHFMNVFQLSMLFRDTRFHMESKPSGLAGAYIIGLAFAFGWTPCVGPILATILFIAGSEDSISSGVGLLATYSAGLGIPFLLAAFSTRPFMRLITKFKRHMPKVEKFIGTLLVITGILFVTDSMNVIGFWLLELFPNLGKVG
jgi:cytochrome c-type biogenesis protein